MLAPTFVTWILVVFGLITCLPLFLAQFLILRDPKGEKAKDILIGEGEEWRDHTHFRSAYGMAWVDWLLWLPLLGAGSTGVLLGTVWGYVLWAGAGAISLYINIVLWFLEKEYVYPSVGPLRYFTYYWGFFVYWGGLAVAYTLARLAAI
jgi:hypothetical protein